MHSQEKLNLTDEHKTSKFKVGDQVLLKRGCTRNKFESRYYPEPHYIINIKGGIITVVNKSTVSYTRNVSFFKLYVNDANSRSDKINIQKHELKQYPKRQSKSVNRYQTQEIPFHRK